MRKRSSDLSISPQIWSGRPSRSPSRESRTRATRRTRHPETRDAPAPVVPRPLRPRRRRPTIPKTPENVLGRPTAVAQEAHPREAGGLPGAAGTTRTPPRPAWCSRGCGARPAPPAPPAVASRRRRCRRPSPQCRAAFGRDGGARAPALRAGADGRRRRARVARLERALSSSPPPPTARKPARRALVFTMRGAQRHGAPGTRARRCCVCAAVTRRDGLGQETYLNLLLRNYLHYSEYEQAEKLRSKAQTPASRSNPQQCRHLYYLGRIRAVQLEYSEAKACLTQAHRKAPAAARGFAIELTKWITVVRLLLGEIPERRDLFPSGPGPREGKGASRKARDALAPYAALAQAVRARPGGVQGGGGDARRGVRGDDAPAVARLAATSSASACAGSRSPTSISLADVAASGLATNAGGRRRGGRATATAAWTPLWTIAAAGGRRGADAYATREPRRVHARRVLPHAHNEPCARGTAGGDGEARRAQRQARARAGGGARDAHHGGRRDGRVLKRKRVRLRREDE